MINPFSRWPEFMIIEISLERELMHTSISVKIYPKRKLSQTIGEFYRLDFSSALEAIWKHLGADIDDDLLRRLYPYSFLDGELYSIKGQVDFGILFLLSFGFLFLTTGFNPTMNFHPTISLLMISMGFIGILLRKYAFKDQSDRIERLYPNR
jgi:hypothetical protein